MTAEVRIEYTAYCIVCHYGEGPYSYEEDAENWASEHDAEFHNEPDRDDADRDHYLESLREP